MAWAADCLIDAPATAKNTTSPTPIINAEAVVAVRLGLRMAFSRASSPVMPMRARGAPMTRLTGEAKLGASTATPMNTRNAPAPTFGSGFDEWVKSPM